MNTKKLCQVAAISMTLLVGAGATTGTASADPAPQEDVYSEITDADIADPSAVIVDSPVDMEAAKTANQAISWFARQKGSRTYEGYCERAVRLSWARKSRHASAIAHWRSSDGTRRTTGTPPKGAFVFWNISKYGHVGIADGAGGVWATGVKRSDGKRAIGHAKRSYFRNYLGWKTGNSN